MNHSPARNPWNTVGRGTSDGVSASDASANPHSRFAM